MSSAWIRPLSELDQVDWDKLDHAYGPASDVPEVLQHFESDDPEDRVSAFDFLEGVLSHQGDFYPSTAEAIPFLLGIVRRNARPAVSAKLLRYVADVYLTAHYSQDARVPSALAELLDAELLAEREHRARETAIVAKQLLATFDQVSNFVKLFLSDSHAGLRAAAVEFTYCEARMAGRSDLELLEMVMQGNVSEKTNGLNRLEGFFSRSGIIYDDRQSLKNDLLRYFLESDNNNILWGLYKLLNQTLEHDCPDVIYIYLREIYLSPKEVASAERDAIEKQVVEEFGFQNLTDFLENEEIIKLSLGAILLSMKARDIEGAVRSEALRRMRFSGERNLDLLPLMLEDIFQPLSLASDAVLRALSTIPVEERSQHPNIQKAMGDFFIRAREVVKRPDGPVAHAVATLHQYWYGSAPHA